MKLKWIILIVVGLLLVASVGAYIFIKGEDECRMDFQCEPATFNDPIYGSTEVPAVCCKEGGPTGHNWCATKGECQDGGYHI